MPIVTPPSHPVQASSLADYFRNRLRESAHAQAIQPDDDTLWYLGNLMTRFAHSEHLFDGTPGRRGIRPLALLYADARETRDERQRCQLLQRLGDLALFLGALYPEVFERRGVRRDYFIGMGSGAYDYLADNAHTHRPLFRGLTRQFVRWLNLVAGAGERDTGLQPDDILRLHRLWLETGNPRLADQLRLLGIQPEAGAVH